VVSSLLAFALVVVITRGLELGGAGVLFEAIALFTILSNVAEMGADTGLLRLVAWNRAKGRVQDLRRLIWVGLVPAIGGGVVLGAVVLLIAPWLAERLVHRGDVADAADYLRVLAPFIPFATGTTVALAGTRGFDVLVPYVAVQNVGIPALRPLLIVATIAAGAGATALALGYGLPAAIGFVIAVTILFRLLGRAERRDLPSGPPSSLSQVAGDFWRFAFPRGVAAMCVVAIQWINVLFVGALATASGAGLYAAAFRYVGVGTVALAALSVAMAPQISGLLAIDERDRARRVFQTGTWWLIAVSFPIYITLAVFAPVFMGIFGRGFQAGSVTLMILAVSALALVGTGNNKTVLLMGGKSGWSLISAIIALALDIVLCVVLIPPFGVPGAAVAFAAAVIADNLITTIVVWRVLGLDPFGRGYALVSAAAFGCFGVLGSIARIAFGASFATLAVSGMVTSVIYAVILWRFRGMLQLSAIRDALRVRAAAGPGLGAAAKGESGIGNR
jgi:O-antigen/teichoic acid export membrane protein